MVRARLVGILSVLTAMLVAGACGSAAKSGSGPASTTTSPTVKLALASGERTLASSAPRVGPAIFPVRPTRYVLDAKLPDLGAQAVVWRMHPHPVDAGVVQHFARVLGLAGTPAETPSGWEVQGTSAILSFVVSDAGVTVSYSSGVPSAVGGSTGSAGTATSPSAVANGPREVAPPSPLPVGTPPTVDARSVPPVAVPSAADATSIARGLLDRLGVSAGQDWSSVVNDSAGVAVSCAAGVPCPTVPPEVSARTVTLSLMLDGTRVDGVDWTVTIGEHRRIESLYGEWANAVAISSYPLRSTAAVFTDLQRGTAKFAGPQPMTAMSDVPAIDVPAIEAPIIATSPSTGTIPTVTVHVTGVSLGVSRWNAYDNGRAIDDLVPTYRFHAHIDGGSTYDLEVLALDPHAITFTNPAPTPRPLPPSPAPARRPAPGSAVTPSSP